MANKLQPFLTNLFSVTPQLYQSAAQFQLEHQSLSDAFGVFGVNLAVAKTDPEYFARGVTVDVQQIRSGLIILKVFGADEIRMCFAVVRNGGEITGRITVYRVRPYDIALRRTGSEQLLGYLTFDRAGKTQIKRGKDDALNITDRKDGLALATAIILAAFSEDLY